LTDTSITRASDTGFDELCSIAAAEDFCIVDADDACTAGAELVCIAAREDASEELDIAMDEASIIASTEEDDDELPPSEYGELTVQAVNNKNATKAGIASFFIY
jgi:hypothetical protein